MLPVDGFPLYVYKEVTVCWGAWRLLLFIIRLNNQGDQCDKENAELEQFLPCNHIHHPLSLDWGQEALPPMKGGTAYRGAVAPRTVYFK